MNFSPFKDNVSSCFGEQTLYEVSLTAVEPINLRVLRRPILVLKESDVTMKLETVSDHENQSFMNIPRFEPNHLKITENPSQQKFSRTLEKANKIDRQTVSSLRKSRINKLTTIL